MQDGGSTESIVYAFPDSFSQMLPHWDWLGLSLIGFLPVLSGDLSPALGCTGSMDHDLSLYMIFRVIISQ
jgi:hypothetical protein